MEWLRVSRQVAQARPGMNLASVRQTVRNLTRIHEAAKNVGWVKADTPAAETLDLVAGRGPEWVRRDMRALFPQAGEYSLKLYRWALGVWRDAIALTVAP